MKTRKFIIIIGPIFFITAAVIVILFTFGIPTDNQVEQAIDWLSGMQDSNTGLLDSYQDSNNKWGGTYNDTYPKMGHLYDQALAIIVFTCAKENAKAKKVLDALDKMQLADGSLQDSFNVNNYSIINHRRYIGANSWVILAIVNYTSLTGDISYIEMAKACADWIIDQQIKSDTDQYYGAVKGGYENDETQANWISTEFNCDAYAALKSLGIYLNDSFYTDNATLIKNWIFNKAFLGDKFIGGIKPTGKEDYSQVLDAQTFSFLGFIKDASIGEKQMLNNAITWATKTIANGGLIEENFVYSTITFKGTWFGKYVYWDEDMAVNKYSHIWWEGTAQLAAVLGIQGNIGAKDIYLTELIKTQDNGGIPYSFTATVEEIDPVWPYNLPYNSVAATAWFYFACNSINPFNPKINHPPALNPIGNKSIKENELLQFTISAIDPDNDTLTYSASNLPIGATFDSTTRTFKWIATYDQAGNYIAAFNVTDGILIDQELVTIDVINVNRPPVLDPIGNKSAAGNNKYVAENKTLQFTIKATDPDNDTLTYSADKLPIGATLDSATGTFKWTPMGIQIGRYYITFSITDNGIPKLSANTPITIYVYNVPPPAPSNLTAKSYSGKILNQYFVILNWDTSYEDPNMTGFIIIRYNKNTNETVKFFTRFNANKQIKPSFTDGSIDKPGLYMYKVTAIDIYGATSTESNTVTCDIK